MEGMPTVELRLGAHVERRTLILGDSGASPRLVLMACENAEAQATAEPPADAPAWPAALTFAPASATIKLMKEKDGAKEKDAATTGTVALSLRGGEGYTFTVSPLDPPGSDALWTTRLPALVKHWINERKAAMKELKDAERLASAHIVVLGAEGEGARDEAEAEEAAPDTAAAPEPSTEAAPGPASAAGPAAPVEPASAPAASVPPVARSSRSSAAAEGRSVAGSIASSRNRSGRHGGGSPYAGARQQWHPRGGYADYASNPAAHGHGHGYYGRPYPMPMAGGYPAPPPPAGMQGHGMWGPPALQTGGLEGLHYVGADLMQPPVSAGGGLVSPQHQLQLQVLQLQMQMQLVQQQQASGAASEAAVAAYRQQQRAAIATKALVASQMLAAMDAGLSPEMVPGAAAVLGGGVGVGAGLSSPPMALGVGGGAGSMPLMMQQAFSPLGSAGNGMLLSPIGGGAGAGSLSALQAAVASMGLVSPHPQQHQHQLQLLSPVAAMQMQQQLQAQALAAQAQVQAQTQALAAAAAMAGGYGGFSAASLSGGLDPSSAAALMAWQGAMSHDMEAQMQGDAAAEAAVPAADATALSTSSAVASDPAPAPLASADS